MTSQSVALTRAQHKLELAHKLFESNYDYYGPDHDLTLGALVEWAKTLKELEEVQESMNA